MYFVELHKGVHQMIALFQHLGFWNVENKTVWNKSLEIFHILFHATFSISLLAGTLNNNDMEESVFLTATAIGAGIQAVKLYYLIRRRNDIIVFLDQISPLLVENYEEFCKINDKLNKFVTFGKLFVLSFVILNPLTFLYNGIKGERKLHFDIGFPLDWRNNEIEYWITFVYLALQTIYSIVIVLVNILIWYLMLGFAIKYEVLGNQLRRMGTAKRQAFLEKNISEAEKQNLFLQELLVVIKIHQKMRE